MSWIIRIFLHRQHLFIFFLDFLELYVLQLILADINDIQIIWLAFMNKSWHRIVAANFVEIILIAVLHLLHTLCLLYTHQQIVITIEYIVLDKGIDLRDWFSLFRKLLIITLQNISVTIASIFEESVLYRDLRLLLRQEAWVSIFIECHYIGILEV